MPRPLLKIENLSIKRGEHSLLDGLTWNIETGQNWAVAGPNGSGKTSLIRALCGYLSPTSGSLQLLGKTYGAYDWRELRPKIGIVSHTLHVSIPPGESALETVVSGRYAQLDLWKAPTRADRVTALRWLRRFGIRHLEGRPWLFLSQGERQKVMIARALMARPKLLILDEPCSGLDPVARQHLLAALPSVISSRNHPSLILITHHLEEVSPLFKHALLLRAGHSIAAGPIGKVFTSRLISAAFDHRIRVKRLGAKWCTRVA